MTADEIADLVANTLSDAIAELSIRDALDAAWAAEVAVGTVVAGLRGDMEATS